MPYVPPIVGYFGAFPKSVVHWETHEVTTFQAYRLYCTGCVEDFALKVDDSHFAIEADNSAHNTDPCDGCREPLTDEPRQVVLVKAGHPTPAVRRSVNRQGVRT